MQNGFFTEDAKYGGVAFDPNLNLDEQVSVIVEILCKRIIEDRAANRAAMKEDAAIMA